MKLKQVLEATYHQQDHNYSEIKRFTRHGGAYDRGRADSYYGRARVPHYMDLETHQRVKVNHDSHEYRAYMQGYEDNERDGDHKMWESLHEARHISDVDWYECPDCEGKGGFMQQNGPDDWDLEMCDMCHGNRRIPKALVKMLTKSPVFLKPHDEEYYTRDDFKPIREAKYSGANWWSVKP